MPELSKDTTCAKCSRPLQRGLSLEYLRWNKDTRRWSDKQCPPARESPPGAEPSSGPSVSSGGSAGQTNAPLDLPIYTLHIVEHRENDKLIWTETNAGISTRGRKPGKLEELDVASMVRNGGH